MKRLLFLAIAASFVSLNASAQTVNANTINVTNKIKLRTNTVTSIQRNGSFISDSSLPTSKAVKKFFDDNYTVIGVPNLQSVTTSGAITSNGIICGVISNGFIEDDYCHYNDSGLTFKKNDQYSYFHINQNGPTSLITPVTTNERVIPVSVNGVFADQSGNVQIPISDLPYKSFVFLMTQNGSGAPNLTTIFNNTNLTFTSTRNGVGDYIITSSSPIDASKLFMSGNINGSAALFDTPSVGTSTTVLYVSTYTSWGFSTLSDNLLSHKIEIRVYQ
jgi:hypothetical protein